MQESSHNFRFAGVVMLGGTILFLISSFLPAYFRRLPPTDPLERLHLIAGDPFGWTAQAILFPIATAVIAVSFGLATIQLPASAVRWLAMAATALSAVACLLWIPISVERLRLGSAAASMIQNFNPNAPPQVMVTAATFWPYTIATIVSIALLGAALAMGDVLPRMGWIVAVLALLSAVIGVLAMRDWPPFMSYLFTLALAIALLRSG